MTTLDFADDVTRSYYDLSVGHKLPPHPNMKYNTFVEPLFFTELDVSGKVLDLALVTLTLDWNMRLVGISFQYGEDKVVQHGSDVGQNLNLRLDSTEDEKLSYLVVFGLDSEWAGIEVCPTPCQIRFITWVCGLTNILDIAAYYAGTKASSRRRWRRWHQDRDFDFIPAYSWGQCYRFGINSWF